MNTCIFAGPTLPPRDEARAFDALWLPPAGHGDVYRAVTLLRPRAIGIVDGYFQSVPSVWHKEILWTLQQGVHVFGAASMGALRAAELAPFGMRGVGQIFAAYRDGVLGDFQQFEDDDEVAVVHGPAESGYLAASEAMVNIRCTLADAQRTGVISATTRARLVSIAKALFFPERSYDRLLQRAREEGIVDDELRALEAWLPHGRINQKRADALAMLEAMRKFLAQDPAPVSVDFRFEHTTLWERAVADLQPAAPHDSEEARALDELRLEGKRFDELRLEAVHTLVGSIDEAASPIPSSGERDAAALLKEREKQEALRRAGDDLPQLLVERQMVARIRESGEYAKLLARAQDKLALLAARTDLPDVEDFSELQLLQLRDWYFSRPPGRQMPDDLEHYLRGAGYPDTMRFHAAIFAEYVYREMSGGGAAAGDCARVSA